MIAPIMNDARRARLGRLRWAAIALAAGVAVAVTDGPAAAADATCAPGLAWCTLSGRCVNPSCLACCQFGTTCAAASDCGPACVTCADGSTSCALGQCGTDLAGQCFFPEPVCAGSPPPVPALPHGLAAVACGALALLGAGAVRRRARR
jgi:hypothetical protein